MDKKSAHMKQSGIGLYDRPVRNAITGIEIVAVLLSALWLLGAAAFFFVLGPGTGGESPVLQGLMVMMAVFLPGAMIWVAAIAARTSKIMREESQRLQTAIDAIQQAYVAQAQGRGMASEPSVNKKLDEIAAATKKAETVLATFSSTRERQPAPLRPTPPPAPALDSTEQAHLPLGTQPDDFAPVLARADFIRALNFPETTEDTEGFAALRKALRDRKAKELINASQDVLTLLSQEGIYTDDMRPDMARPELWRRFAAGERGRTIAALGGIRDRTSLALVAGRMKQDPVFRDAAHHFLRRFDKAFQEFEIEATDSEIQDLAQTRTARAFMLLGRVAGIFD